MKFREDELKERALKILEINSTDDEELKKAYRRKARQVHPDISNQDDKIMGVVSQAYAFLKRKEKPTSLLENDGLVSLIIGEKVTPIELVQRYENWQRTQFYSNGIPSI